MRDFLARGRLRYLFALVVLAILASACAPDRNEQMDNVNGLVWDHSIENFIWIRTTPPTTGRTWLVCTNDFHCTTTSCPPGCDVPERALLWSGPFVAAGLVLFGVAGHRGRTGLAALSGVGAILAMSIGMWWMTRW